MTDQRTIHVAMGGVRPAAAFDTATAADAYCADRDREGGTEPTRLYWRSAEVAFHAADPAPHQPAGAAFKDGARHVVERIKDAAALKRDTAAIHHGPASHYNVIEVAEELDDLAAGIVGELGL